MPKSRGAGLKVGLVFPSTYFVGMSNLGYHVIYRLLAARQDVLVERLFYPGPKALPRSTDTLVRRASTAENRPPKKVPTNMNTR